MASLTTFNRDWIEPNVIVIAALGKGTGVDGRSRRTWRCAHARCSNRRPTATMKAIGGQDPRLGEHMERTWRKGRSNWGDVASTDGRDGQKQRSIQGTATLTMVGRHHLLDDIAGDPAHAKAARFLHRKGHRGRCVSLPHAQTAIDHRPVPFLNNSKMCNRKFGRCSKAFGKTQKAWCTRCRSQGVNLKFRLAMTLPQEHGSGARGAFGVHGGGYSRCSTIAHRKACGGPPDPLQADPMGLAEVVQLEAWNPADQTVPSLGLSDDELDSVGLDSRSENGQLIDQNAGIDELTGYMVCDGKVIVTYNRGVCRQDGHDGAYGTYPTFPFHWSSAESHTRCSA